MQYIGNKDLLNLSKTAFLCSRKVPASIVLKCYDWSIEQREKGNCIIGGFHSTIEKDVLHYLLKGNQPLIIVMARGMKHRLEPAFRQALEKGRLLIISPFEQNVKRITAQTALRRNQLMIELADSIAVGFVHKGGTLEKLLGSTEKMRYQI